MPTFKRPHSSVALELKHKPRQDDVVREVAIWGDFLPPADDIRIEGPWKIQEAWSEERRAPGRGMRYDVTVSLTTFAGEGTIRFSSTKWPGIIDMKDALLREWYVQPELAAAVAKYAREHIDAR